jgi:uncharacterized lipoprotein YajG
MLATLLVAGCATTYQIVPINPRIDVSQIPARGNGRSLALEVVDTRADPVIGYRGAPGDETEITAAPETIRNIRDALERVYTGLGFRVVPPLGEADIQLRVELTELTYARETEGLLREINTGATLKATSTMAQRTVTGTYKEGQGKEGVLKPSMRENARILNDHLSKALQRLAADAQLTAEQ